MGVMKYHRPICGDGQVKIQWQNIFEHRAVTRPTIAHPQHPFDRSSSREYSNLATDFEMCGWIAVEDGSEGTASGKLMNRF
jgi:hypothetical protein